LALKTGDAQPHGIGFENGFLLTELHETDHLRHRNFHFIGNGTGAGAVSALVAAREILSCFTFHLLEERVFRLNSTESDFH
jgi:hypothetical protein